MDYVTLIVVDRGKVGSILNLKQKLISFECNDLRTLILYYPN